MASHAATFSATSRPAAASAGRARARRAVALVRRSGSASRARVCASPRAAPAVFASSTTWPSSGSSGSPARRRAFARKRVPTRPSAVRSDGDVPRWLEDERWNEVVDEANANGEEEDGASLAMSSDFANGEPVEYDRSFAVWICMAVSAVVYSVPFGFVRWNLSSLAPLVWWQLGLSTAVGTMLAMPLIAAITYPAAKAGVNFPIFARAAFGVRGAFIADAGRGVLGFFLFTLITLAGGEALLSLLSACVNGGVVFDGVLANPATFLGGVERAVAYCVFWGLQVAIASIGPDKRLMWCARLALLAVGGLASMTAAEGIADAGGFGAAPLAEIPPEFWQHAALTTGVWFTLSAMLPDYARRAVNRAAFLKAQATWLPVLAGAAAIAGAGVSSAPALLGLPVIVASCLVTNSVAASVGPIASVRAVRPMSGKVAAVAVAAMALAAAPLALTWQQVIAASSWAVGIGSLLVAPTIGVMLADFYVTKSRSIDFPQLFKVPPADWAADPEWAKRDDAYWYQGGVHLRAVASILIGAAPNLISLFSGLSMMLQKTGQMKLNLYVVNSEYSSLVGAAIAAAVYLLSFALGPAVKSLKRPLYAAITFLVEAPERLINARALHAQKRLEASLALKAATENAQGAQEWIDAWRAERGLTADPMTVRALRFISTANVAEKMELAERKRITDATRAMEIAMNKPDVVRARAEMNAAMVSATASIRAFEDAQMMADGPERDAAVAEAERVVEECFQAKVAAEMRYESVVYSYTSTIVTTSTTIEAAREVMKSSATATDQATEAKASVKVKTDEARRVAAERSALEAKRAELERLTREAKEDRERRELELAEKKREAEELERVEMERIEMQRRSEMSSSSSTSTTSTTTTTTTEIMGDKFEYRAPVGGGAPATDVEYDGIPGYYVPLLLFVLFTIAVVEGLGDVMHL